MYKKYDYSGRAHASLTNKAQWAAVKVLATNSFRKDSPIRVLQQRFPDKYEQQDQKAQINVSDVISNIFPEMERSPNNKGCRVGALSARTFTDTQFVLEASFNAVSDILVHDLNKWTSKSVVDKCLQFVSLICHQRKDIRLGGVICLYLMLKANTVP